MWLEEGERKRSRRGQQRPPLTASLGADRLGGRPAGSRVRARRPGPDFRRASESCGHCAERKARSSPPRDVSGSRTLSGGPRRAQPDRPSDPRALRELRSPRRAAGARWEQPLRAGRASLWPDPCSRWVLLLPGLSVGDTSCLSTLFALSDPLFSPASDYEVLS